MNAPAGFHTAARTATEPPPAAFQDPAAAWSGPRQRVVLEAFAEGCTVPDACRRVGLTPASLYAFANAPEGRRFSLGWDTAMLRSRRAIQDLALLRVVDGFEERTMRANGEVVVRHRYDNRLMMRMLERLDRHAESYGPQSLSGARRIDEDFGEFLDSISDDPVANHAAIVESARPGALPGWAGRHAPTVFDDIPVHPAGPHRGGAAAAPVDLGDPAVEETPAPELHRLVPEQSPVARRSIPLPGAPSSDRDTTAVQPQAAEHGDGGHSELPFFFGIRWIHDRDSRLVDLIVTSHPESITRVAAEEAAYASLRASSDPSLPATLAGFRAQHGRAGCMPSDVRKLWQREGGGLVEVAYEDLGGMAGQGSA